MATRLSISVSDDFKQELDKQAKQHHQSSAALLRDSFEQYAVLEQKRDQLVNLRLQDLVEIIDQFHYQMMLDFVKEPVRQVLSKLSISMLTLTSWREPLFWDLVGEQLVRLESDSTSWFQRLRKVYFSSLKSYADPLESITTGFEMNMLIFAESMVRKVLVDYFISPQSDDYDLLFAGLTNTLTIFMAERVKEGADWTTVYRDAGSVIEQGKLWDLAGESLSKLSDTNNAWLQLCCLSKWTCLNGSYSKPYLSAEEVDKFQKLWVKYLHAKRGDEMTVNLVENGISKLMDDVNLKVYDSLVGWWVTKYLVINQLTLDNNELTVFPKVIQELLTTKDLSLNGGAYEDLFVKLGQSLDLQDLTVNRIVSVLQHRINVLIDSQKDVSK